MTTNKQLIERLNTGKVKCPSLAPTLTERPLAPHEWREAGRQAAQAISALTAEVEELREALEPFARAADIRLCGEWADDKKPVGRKP